MRRFRLALARPRVLAKLGLECECYLRGGGGGGVLLRPACWFSSRESAINRTLPAGRHLGVEKVEQVKRECDLI